MQIVDNSEWMSQEKQRLAATTAPTINEGWWQDNVHSQKQMCWSCSTVVKVDPTDVFFSAFNNDPKWTCPMCKFTVRVKFATEVRGLLLIAVKKYVEHKKVMANVFGCILMIVLIFAFFGVFAVITS